jgi:hypothetical protein
MSTRVAPRKLKRSLESKGRQRTKLDRRRHDRARPAEGHKASVGRLDAHAMNSYPLSRARDVDKQLQCHNRHPAENGGRAGGR